jgi:hypothetical protein
MSMSTTATATRASPRGRWTALNIVLMILGFALFWPLGLAMLAWIMWGEEIGARFEEFTSHFHGRQRSARASFSGTGNAAFDEYRAREIERLAEERRKLEEMRAEFDAFLKELRRVKDQEEFERFMGEFRNRTGERGEPDAASA